MADIFLSYSRLNQPVAHHVAQAFEREGFKVWWDTTLRAGEAYDEVTESALRAAKAGVVLWSKTSVASRWVRAEATLADRNGTLIPAMIEPCERPIMFELTQTADLSNWKGDPHDPAWTAFCADVHRCVNRAPAVGVSHSAPIDGEMNSGMHLPAPRTGPPFVAAIPFTNRSGAAEDDVFAIGMVEDVVSALSLGGVNVVASSSTLAYRGDTNDLRAVGRELGAAYLLEGNVRRSDSTLRVTAQLIDADTSAILWTKRFDRPLAQLAALQEDLVLDIARSLGVKLDNIELERALSKPNALTAWEAIVRSHAATNRVDAEALARAVFEARKATEIEPDYGDAHASLASALAIRELVSGSRDPGVMREVRRHVERAMALAPDNAQVLSRVALALSFSGQPDDALPSALLAVELGPNLAAAHRALGITYTLLKRFDDAIEHFDLEEKVAPRVFGLYTSLFWRATAQLQAGRVPEAVQALNRSLQLNPTYSAALTAKLILAGMSGERANAQTYALRLRQAEPDLHADAHIRRIAMAVPDRTVADSMIAIFRPIWEALPVEDD